MSFVKRLAGIIPYIIFGSCWFTVFVLTVFLSPLILAKLVYYKLTKKKPTLKWEKTEHSGWVAK